MMIDFHCPYCNHPVDACKEDLNECWSRSDDTFDYECPECSETCQVTPLIDVIYEVKDND